MSETPTREELNRKIQDLEKEIHRIKAVETRLVLLSSALEQCSDGIAVCDLDGNLIYLNNAFARMHGYTARELQGKNLSIFHTPQQMDSVNSANRRLRETRDFQGEIWHVRQDGAVFPAWMHNSILFDEEEKAVAMIGTARDITERKDAEEALRRENTYLFSLHETVLGLIGRLELEDLLEAILERAGALAGTPHGYIYLYDADEGDLVMRVGQGLYRETLGFRLGPGEGLSGKVFLNGKPLLVNDYRSWPGKANNDRFDRLQSVVGVPLKSGDLVRGVIGLAHIHQDLAFDADDMDMMTRFAELASVALDNAYLYSDLQKELADRRHAEQALRESKKRYESIFDTVLVSIWEEDFSEVRAAVENLKAQGVTDLRRYLDDHPEFVTRAAKMIKIRDVNEATLRLYKAESKLDLLGSLDKVFVPESLPVFKEELLAIAEGKTSFESEIINRNLEGEELYLLLKLTIPPEKDKFSNMVVSIMDITERRRAEEALKESEERFRSAFANAALGMTLVNLQGDFLSVNPFLCNMLGYAEKELTHMNVKDVTHPEDLDMDTQTHLRLIRGEIPYVWMEKRYIHHDGHVVWGLLSSSVLRDRDGQPLYLVAQVQDMTERKLAEEAIRESERRFRELAEMLPGTIFEADEAGRLTFVNRNAFDHFRYTQEDFEKGLNCLDMVVPEDRQRATEDIQRQMTGEGGGIKEYTALRNDGTAFPAMIHTAIIQREGRRVGMRGFVIDVSEKADLEAQFHRAQKIESIGTLAGGIAHDFNNLLMGIQGRTSLTLMDTSPSHPHYEHLRGIEEYVRSAANLTRQLLAFARGGKYEAKPTDLNALITKNSEMFGRTKKEIRISRKLQDGLWAVEADPGQIDQVLMNLYVNAWQAMPDGGDLQLQTMNVTLEDADVQPFKMEPGAYVRISITDTGVGMDRATQERIFDPFFTTKEMARGTGLGLASAYGIIRNHGGLINVNSKPGEGTTFEIYLPASGKEIEPQEEPPEEVLKGTETILLVDDEAMILEVGTRILENLGYSVLVAQRGEQAVGLYEENRDCIDMVVLDMIMPGMSGGETFDRLRALNPEIRVLLSSGYSLDGQADAILSRGCSGFIQKPFNIKALSRKLREILSTH